MYKNKSRRVIRSLFSTLAISGSVLFSVCSTNVMAFEYQWPTNPVIGVIGASYADCSLPLNTPLAGVGYAGCSYEALEKKLTKNHIIDKMGMTVQSAAQAGSYSYDVAGTDWKGSSSQLHELMMRTFWFFDTEQRLQYLVVSIPNDCLHSIPCAESDMQSYIDNIKQAVTTATSAGITVIVNGYPEWEGMDLNAAGVAFGLTNLIDEANYKKLSQMHEEQLSAMSGVVYMKVWKDNFATIDGLHPLPANQMEAADRIARMIKDIEKGKL